jgi:hypothetical protein
MESKDFLKKTPVEFFATFYTIHDLIENYSFDELMFYLSYGTDILAKLNYIINNDLYDFVGEDKEKVFDDKVLVIVRNNTITKAISSIDPCKVHTHSNMAFVYYLN